MDTKNRTRALGPRRTVASLDDLPTLSSTNVQNRFGGVLDDLRSGGPIVVERHDRPTAVLMSVETYAQLLANAHSGLQLDMLAADFDALVARMQSTRAAAGLMKAFSASPAQLAAAAAPSIRASRVPRADRQPPSASTHHLIALPKPAAKKKRAGQGIRRP